MEKLHRGAEHMMLCNIVPLIMQEVQVLDLLIEQCMYTLFRIEYRYRYRKVD